jgi:hypothetical protein
VAESDLVGPFRLAPEGDDDAGIVATGGVGCGAVLEGLSDWDDEA